MLTARLIHPVLQTVRGMCTDEDPYPAIDAALDAAVEVAKDLEEENERMREAIDAAHDVLTHPGAQYEPNDSPGNMAWAILNHAKEAFADGPR